MPERFDPAALAPAGAYAEDDHPDLLGLDELDEGALTDYVTQVHNLPDDVAKLFTPWFLEGIHTWEDISRAYTWAELVTGALGLWRGNTDPTPYTVTVLDGAEPTDADQFHGDPWDPGTLSLDMADPAALALAEASAKPDRRLVVRPGTRAPDLEAPGVLGYVTLVPRYVLD